MKNLSLACGGIKRISEFEAGESGLSSYQEILDRQKHVCERATCKTSHRAILNAIMYFIELKIERGSEQEDSAAVCVPQRRLTLLKSAQVCTGGFFEMNGNCVLERPEFRVPESNLFLM